VAIGKTVNADIDKAIAKIMKKVGGETTPVEVQVKILNTAIAWEKAKNQIVEGDSGDDWNPDEIFGD
jgi:hypothetical protein